MHFAFTTVAHRCHSRSLSPQPAPSVSVPPASPAGRSPSLPTTHIVARGETLSSIARRYGVTVAAIQKTNQMKDPNLIRVGQHLIIPAP